MFQARLVYFPKDPWFLLLGDSVKSHTWVTRRDHYYWVTAGSHSQQTVQGRVTCVCTRTLTRVHTHDL